MPTRQSVQIPIQPWFMDHHFNGKTIFPAVETMLLLAGIAKNIRPDIHPEGMSGAGFSRLLEIPKRVPEVSALVEYSDDGETLCLKLLSRIQFKKMSRIMEHAEICFSTRPQPLSPVPQLAPTSGGFHIDAERIYRELVPFGPTYRSLVGKLHISNKAAWGMLQAPVLTRQQAMEKELGSPFPLDGAMHAACVLGQCVADFVPFPVAFASRYIHIPTRAGRQYQTTVVPVSRTENELVFDLSIFDTSGQPCETVKGLRMRDVSGGTITPPENLSRPAVFPQSRD